MDRGRKVKNFPSNSIVTITGGTGSFGSTMLDYLLSGDTKEIRVFSRDENKQDSLRNAIKDDRVKFYIGDIRDSKSVENVIEGSDFVFHAAALKQVPSCEFFPMQANLTNVIGSANVIDASFKYNIKSIVCLSTDKAVYPINAMGMTKAMMEKIAYSYGRNHANSETKIAVTRYGNVMMSRGSVIPLFINQIKTGQPITITNPSMTRFMMSLQDSVSLVLHAFANANTGDLFVRKAPACTVQTLVEALILILEPKKSPIISNIGIRHGEKQFESLLGSEENSRAIDEGEYYRVALDTRSLDYKAFFDTGKPNQLLEDSYTSNNTKQLGVDETVDLIKNLPEFKKVMGI